MFFFNMWRRSVLRLHFFILVSAYTNIALLTQVLACWMKNDNLAPPRRSQGIREVDSLFAEFAKFAVKKTIVVKKLNRNTQYFWLCHKSIRDAEPDEHRLGGIGEEKQEKRLAIV